MGDSQPKSFEVRKRSGENLKIYNFFAKKTKTDQDQSNVTNPTPALNVSVESQKSLDQGTAAESNSELPLISVEPSNQETSSVHSEFASDVGHYVDKNDVDDYTKANLLERHWVPPANYPFPHCVVNKKGKPTKKYAQRSHLDRFHWLVLSHKDQGLYCKYCVLFGKSIYQKNTQLGRLVKEPLKSFDDLLGEKGALIKHENNQYHKAAVERGKQFLITYHKPELEVINMVNTQRLEQVEENRERLRPIVSTVVLCGRQNFPFRGHRDDGPINDMEDGESIVSKNDGNFRALLRYRIEGGDKKLENHVETAKSNATYISKTTQNELIAACKEEIQDAILTRVKKAGVYAVIFDETTDISRISQLSLSIRYLYNDTIREDFITFCDAYSSIPSDDSVDSENKEKRLTGAAIARIVEDLLTSFDVDLNNCVGIGTDNCSTMASAVKGAAKILMEKAVHARRCPCSNHVLNNSLARSSKVKACTHVTNTMKKVIAFANMSAKRNAVFKEELKGSLQGLCETRWVERHEGHLQFQGDSLLHICRALQKITHWEDSRTSSDATCLLNTLKTLDFLVASVSLFDVLGTTVGLSRFLQNPAMDLCKATDFIEETLQTLERKREHASENFSSLFAEIKELAEKLGTDIQMPRVVQIQTHRENVAAKNAEEYYRRTVYIPLLENIIGDMKSRLSPEVMNLFKLRIFLPKPSMSLTDKTGIIKEIAHFYKGILPDKENYRQLIAECHLWETKWKRIMGPGEESLCLLDLIQKCDPEMYPGINCLLRVLATMPVSIATSERSFSTLRRLKTWLRSTMGEQRLVGLALLQIHHDIEVNYDNVINRFAKSKRKLDFVI